MKQSDKFLLNKELLRNKYQGNIILIDEEYIKYKQKTNFKCIKHDHTFITSLSMALDKRYSSCCPLCKKERMRDICSKRWYNAKNNISK